MNGACYFETTPWARICEEIRTQEGLSQIVSVSIQTACADPDLEAALSLWKSRLEEILGPAQRTDILQSQHAVSVLQRYSGNAIVRIFLDGPTSDCCENFEIVTRQALYIWKPNSRPQAHIERHGQLSCICSQAYSCDLEAKDL